MPDYKSHSLIDILRVLFSDTAFLIACLAYNASFQLPSVWSSCIVALPSSRLCPAQSSVKIPINHHCGSCCAETRHPASANEYGYEGFYRQDSVRNEQMSERGHRAASEAVWRESERVREGPPVVSFCALRIANCTEHCGRGRR